MPPVQDLPLRDIHVPEAIGWFPPALGWWSMLIFIPIMSYFLIKLLQNGLKRKPIKEAKKLLRQIQYNDALTPVEKVGEISMLLRRVAIRNELEYKSIGGLTGRGWLDYLDRSLKDAPFKNGAGRFLIEAPYQKALPNDMNLDALFELAKKWLHAQ